MQGFWFQSSRSWLWPSGWPQNISTTLNCWMWYSGKDWLHDWWRLQNVAINSKVIFVREIINKPHHEQQRIYSIESGGRFHPILLTHPYTLKEKVKKKWGLEWKAHWGVASPSFQFWNFETFSYNFSAMRTILYLSAFLFYYVYFYKIAEKKISRIYHPFLKLRIDTTNYVICAKNARWFRSTYIAHKEFIFSHIIA